MAPVMTEVLERKLGFLNRYISDLGAYAGRDEAARLRDHYTIERLLQLLCESAADIALQFLKQEAETLPASYREIFSSLAAKGRMPEPLAKELIAACGMRNVLTHLYDEIDLSRVIAAIEPAVKLYTAFRDWSLNQLATLKATPPR
jgi:uncharacterized protein YutE (UPF0331/DUF86 family)